MQNTKITFAVRKELNDLSDEGVLEEYQMFGHVLEQSQKASLRIEPSVRTELLLVRLQALHNTRNTEFVVALGTIQRSIYIEDQ